MKAGINLVDGVRYSAKLPALFIHIPGKVYTSLNNGLHESLFFSYQKDMIPVIQSFNINFEPLLREINETKRLNTLVREFHELSANIHDFGNVDRMDRLAETLILETLLSPQKLTLCENEKKARKVASYIERHFQDTINIDELLLAYGITSRTFLRYWKIIQPLPPNKYINYLRIEEAKRLLESTKERINDIAEQVGFNDPFYFTRLFSKQVGISPIRYRYQENP